MDHHDGPITVRLFPPGAIHNGGVQVKTVKTGAAAEADTDDNKFLLIARSITSVVLIIANCIGHLFNSRSNYIFVCPSFIHLEPSAMPRTKASPKKCVKSQVANNTLLLILKGNHMFARNH